ncbi:MAG: 1-phosphatidylinositol-3-phosphate 5-kinase [Phylliscum demangeonii]|nr:MAG: 1-phosphatidylinositol-3-phosphate 5-kinase [Phylliscum demangeonii]
MGSRLPAFHVDSIVDPDLALYASDEESSEDEQMSLSAAMNGDVRSSTQNEHDKPQGTVLSTSAKKSHSRGSKSESTTSTSLLELRLKSLLPAASLQHRLLPKGYRPGSILRGLGSALPDMLGGVPEPEQDLKRPGLNRSRMTRSASLKGLSAPAVELNSASLSHVRRLLCQLLRNVKVINVHNWERALMPILLRCTDDVNPDVRNGDDIDICHYVKIKRIPGGRPTDTSYVSGVVCSKNLALKNMARSILHPRVAIITFPLEYNRHQQHFMSLDPVIAQEKEYLYNLVNRIVALRPQLLLAQRNISGLALDYLAQANVATAFNVKPAVLEAVARCAQADIISSVDMLALKSVQLGTCEGFDVKTYVHPDIPGRKKTCLYLSGCPPDLGCTIVLRGENVPILAQLKRITEFMVYVVYNLKLETCLMRDEFVRMPSVTSEGSIGKDLGHGADASTAPNDLDLGQVKGERTSSMQEAGIVTVKTLSLFEEDRDPLLERPLSLPDNAPRPAFYGDMVEKHQSIILSASPFVEFMQPYLLMRARKQESRISHLAKLRDRLIAQETVPESKVSNQPFQLIQPEILHRPNQDAPRKVIEVLRAVYDAEYDRTLYQYETLKRQWEAYIAGNVDLFDPYAHQNIVILYSLICTSTTIPCAGPDLLSLAFYNEHAVTADFDPDCSLGQFVEDLCLGVHSRCTANACDKKMIDHHRSYVHGEGRISVFMEAYPCKISGLQESILMWSFCKVCNKEMQVMPMSESTWKYSFGKYLELSFWSSNLCLRAGVCPHNLHRDHIRYFGYKDFALRVHYDPIELLEIVVPRSRITWNVELDLRLKNDIYRRTEDRMNRFMSTVKARLKGLSPDMTASEKVDEFKRDIDRLIARANDDHHLLIHKLQKRYMKSKYYEIIPLNRAVRALQTKVAEWDMAFAEVEASFFPSENDITRLAVAQMKKIFLDRDTSASSVTTLETAASLSASEADEARRASAPDFTGSAVPKSSKFAKQAPDVLASVEDERRDPSATEDQATHQQIGGTAVEDSVAADESVADRSASISTREISHLDLAVPPTLPEKQLLRGSQLDMEPGAVQSLGADQTQGGSATELAARGQASGMDTGHDTNPVRNKRSQASGIPIPVEGSSKKKPPLSPPLLRTRSQPAQFQGERAAFSADKHAKLTNPSVSHSIAHALKAGESRLEAGKKLEKLKSDASRTTNRAVGRSHIPRLAASKRHAARVSTLAKHFEELSREFEKERVRERRQRAATTRRSRLQPKNSSKPIVEVYKNVQEAADEGGDERDPSDTEAPAANQTRASTGLTSTAESDVTGSTAPIAASESPVEVAKGQGTQAESRSVTDVPTDVDAPASEGGEGESDTDTAPDDGRFPAGEDPETLAKLELPKHERSSMMKMLSNFWAERSASGWAALDYPLSATDHVFLDSDLIIREDEPSSLIAFALSSEDYKAKVLRIRQQGAGGKGQAVTADEQAEVERSLLRSTGTHLKYQFQEGTAKMLCKIFYAEQFDAVRRKCGVADRIVESMSRCVKWDSKGGKTRSVFLKTLDERFVLKALSPVETQAFLRFAPAYFQIMSEALFHELPSVIAKMLGFYRIHIKNPVTGTEIRWDVLVMENLFYDRTPTRIFDLKGSMRNRKIQSTGQQDEVLLDENMVEFIYESPLFVREHSKKLLRASVWNDTLFLARQNVMDYSLMIAVDDRRKELVVGIVDCIRTYTWDKKLESWIKDRGFAGGGKNKPTVTSPKEYKSRFREAMARYVLQAPK